MKWGWFSLALIVWMPSAACAVGMVIEAYRGKGDIRKPDFWGGAPFTAAPRSLRYGFS
jgi:hypothetical protein